MVECKGNLDCTMITETRTCTRMAHVQQIAHKMTCNLARHAVVFGADQGVLLLLVYCVCMV